MQTPTPRANEPRALFRSLLRLRELPFTTLVLAAHASEPIAFDGQPITASLSDVGRWLSGWLMSETAFVERVTSNLPPVSPASSSSTNPGMFLTSIAPISKPARTDARSHDGGLRDGR
jgi:hypothetical protein